MEIGELASQDSDSAISKKLKYNEEGMAKDEGHPNDVAESILTPEKSSNLDLSYHDDNDGDDIVDDDQDMAFDYEDNDDYMYDNDDDDDDDDDYLRMQAQFDNVDLPTGVEVSVSWLKDPAPSGNIPVAASTSTQSNTTGLSAGAGTSASILPDLAVSNNNPAALSSSTDLAESSCKGLVKETNQDEVLRKFEAFKRFDTVDDFPDHHFNGVGSSGHQPPKAWAKKIQEEWKILEKDLPETIFVRVCETRMDLLRAIISGPAGTPYHDGLFVFDVLFPPTYPDIPPMVYYYSGGLRLNPNLYDCGKVCLSLLNTWSGRKNEMWMPKTSTMLQVLVSIQALILNAKPFFNEPGYENTYVGPEGDRRSKAYNEDVFILSLKTMIYTLRRPPKHFENLVAGHFRVRAYDILSACKAYMDGAVVGSVVRGRDQNGSGSNQGCSKAFKDAVAKMMNGLVTNFTRNGSTDCEQFRIQG